MEKQTGGPAFPCHPEVENPMYDGMTLRDYFAAKAMQGLVTGWASDSLAHSMDQVKLASAAYKIADAMLLEREK